MDEREIFMAKQAMQSALMKGPVMLALMFGAILVGLLVLHPWIQIGAGERGVALILALFRRMCLEKDCISEYL